MEEIDLRRKLGELLSAAQRERDRRVAEVLSAAAVENPFHNPAHWMSPSAFIRSPIFQMKDGKLTEVGLGPVEYLNPARRVIERVRAETDARRTAFKPEPLAVVCATLYQLAADVDGVSKGALICGQCEEVWDVEAIRLAAEHEAKGRCLPVAVEHRSPSARAFYAWCKSNGFLGDVQP